MPINYIFNVPGASDGLSENDYRSQMKSAVEEIKSKLVDTENLVPSTLMADPTIAPVAVEYSVIVNEEETAPSTLIAADTYTYQFRHINADGDVTSTIVGDPLVAAGSLQIHVTVPRLAYHRNAVKTEIFRYQASDGKVFYLGAITDTAQELWIDEDASPATELTVNEITNLEINSSGYVYSCVDPMANASAVDVPTIIIGIGLLITALKEAKLLCIRVPQFES